MNSQMDKLYNDIARQQGLRKTKKRSKGGMSQQHQTKINHWIRNMNRKYSHDKNKTGYRNDCSGFVSYMWGIPPGEMGGAYTKKNTANHILNYCKTIHKDDLRFGDGIYIHDKHIILFDKWADKEHKSYWGYQMCNQGDCRGFTHKVIPFPFSEFRKPNAKEYSLVRYYPK